MTYLRTHCQTQLGVQENSRLQRMKRHFQISEVMKSESVENIIGTSSATLDF